MITARPTKRYLSPQATGIDAVSVASTGQTESTIFKWTPGLICLATLKIDVTAGTGGAGELAIRQYDPDENAISSSAVDILTALDFDSTLDVYFLFGPGVSAGVVGGGAEVVEAAADVMILFTNFSLELDVSVAHSGGAATASLHMVFLD